MILAALLLQGAAMRIDLLRPVAAASLLVAACAHDGKGTESDADFDAKSDSFFRPTEHGSLVPGTEQEAALSPDARFHAWTFRLTDAAEVALDLGPGAAGGGDPDTVMYLYKRRADGTFGRFMVKNDDASADSTFSAIHRALDAGSYRVIVKGFDIDEAGAFAIKFGCTGAGCAGPLTFDLPILDENGDGLYSELNDELIDHGFDPAPDILTITADDAGRDAFSALTDRLAAAADQFDTLPFPMRFADPLDYTTPGADPIELCFRGPRAEVAVGLQDLGDNVFSDMFFIWAWRFDDATHEAEDGTLDDLATDLPPEWTGFDPAAGKVVILYTTDDAGDNPTAAAIPPCID